jgi:hypothetical protein
VGNRNSYADKSNGVFSKHGDPVRGYHYLHTTIDGHSRLASTELLADERKGDGRRVLGSGQHMVH